MPRFSANLGFLWTELDLPDAIRAAKRAGFEAVECHFPYQWDPMKISAALSETGLPMLGLNTRLGDVSNGEFGICALPGREEEAQKQIDEAIDYAIAIGCRAVHVMGGKSGGGEEAEQAYRTNLRYAAERAATANKTILIEPINHRDAPGYHLHRVEDARATIEELGYDNIRILFDCYHTQIMQGDLLDRLTRNLDLIGHVQIAAVPDRGEPDMGEVDFKWLLTNLDAAGYEGFVGAEYKPRDRTDAGLGWMQTWNKDQ